MSNNKCYKQVKCKNATSKRQEKKTQKENMDWMKKYNIDESTKYNDEFQ